jgi:uncharacterized protein YdhG (YjbR/CyaY superfamily)
MAKTDFKSIDQYHKTLSPEVAGRLQQIRDEVHKIVPDVEEAISYQIPCFKYNGYLIYYSAFTNHISLSHPYSKEFLDEFGEELEGYKVSKSAIQFPNNKPLPVNLISRMIAFRKKENVENAKKKK